MQAAAAAAISFAECRDCWQQLAASMQSLHSLQCYTASRCQLMQDIGRLPKVEATLQQVYCPTPAGALPALAKVADHLQSLLQQPQQLNKQQLMKLFGSGVAVITLVTVTSAIWPQNVLLAKAFEPILCPWVSLSAALLAVLGNPETSQLLWQNAGAFLQAVSNTASSISYIVNSSPRGPSMGLIPPTEAASKFCLSDELQQLLVFQLAVIAHAKHHRYKGVPPIALPLSSRATGSSSSSNQQPQEGQGGQQVQPYHERLLRDLGLQYWKIPKEMIKTLESG